MAPPKVPPRMSGSEVLGCVELVVGAFRDGSELVGRLSRKQKKRKGERSYHEILLFQVLEQGAKQIQQSYNEGSQRFGSAFKVGDDEARERLLCVAIETNANIVSALQIACDIDKATVDLVCLHESAITSRHDAIRSLNDLHQRLERIRPLGSFSRFSPDSSVCGADTRRNSSLINAPEILPGALPPSVTVPQLPEKSGLRRMLSVGGSNQHRRTKSDNPQTLRPTSSQTSIAPSYAASVVAPAPLYFNNQPAYPIATETAPRPVPRPSTQHSRTPSTTSSEHKRQVKAGTNKWEDTKDHPDLPDFQFLKKQKEASKHHRAHSNTSSQPSKRDSAYSLPPRSSWDTPAPLSYPADLPPPPPPPVQRPAAPTTTATTGMIPIHLVTNLPPPPPPPVFTRPTIASPIPEDPIPEDPIPDDTAYPPSPALSSSPSLDYDAASLYSQPELPSPVDSTPATDPSTPSTDLGPSSIHARSSIRSSTSTAPSSVSTPSINASLPSPLTRSRASTTVSQLERQMRRDEDGQWRPIPREPIQNAQADRDAKEKAKARAKAERMYRPLHSASVSTGAPMSLQLGWGLGIVDSPVKSHSRSRTMDSAVGEVKGFGSVMTRTESAFSVESNEEKKEKKKGFWHLKRGSKDVDAEEKEKKKREKEKAKMHRERTVEWSSMAFAV
ncbi:hypothetical protein CAC42_8010 [Sphaceloma murrayae]|uniref:Uncharacterized protein n=1 Tax=Sphaceloma murrayae TaxID=2082308 RepID=A0A2K1QL88_9PEZI|nr:hypothetical protein CAC42_8010 [Sphaceloma murrayae]